MTGPGAPSPAGPASAANDVAMLQTASSLVVLTTNTYQSLQGLPFGGGGAALPLLRDYLAGAVTALGAARGSLGDATRTAGGRPQQAPDPTYAPVVAQALPTVRGPGDVVALGLTLEDVLLQTLTADAMALSTPDRRRLAAPHGRAGAVRPDPRRRRADRRPRFARVDSGPWMPPRRSG